jgi:hypothetical protein
MGLGAYHTSAEHVLLKMNMAVHTEVIRVVHLVGMVQRVVDETAVGRIAVVLGVKVTRLTGPIISGHPFNHLGSLALRRRRIINVYGAGGMGRLQGNLSLYPSSSDQRIPRRLAGCGYGSAATFEKMAVKTPIAGCRI